MERTTGHVVGTPECVMLPTTYLHDHIEALLCLSHDVKDRALSGKLRELADELRIMVSVADITDLAAELSREKNVPLAPGPIDAAPVLPGRSRLMIV